MIKKKINYFAADFENTVPNDIDIVKDLNDKKSKQKRNQDIREFETRVWAAGITSVDNPEKDLFVVDNIDDYFNYLESNKIPDNSIIYYHNLKYDNSFIESFLLKHGYKTTTINKPAKMRCETMFSFIGKQGAYYQTIIKTRKGKVLTFRDSYKILPLSLDKLTHDLKVKHGKLTGTIDYRKDRPEGYKMTEEEIRYFENDIMGLAECLQEIQKEFGLLDNLTIGSACLKEYKQIIGKKFKEWFPPLSTEEDDFCRHAYKGGWCFCKNPSKEYTNIRGYVADVSSLYPYCQHSHYVDGVDIHPLPYGRPTIIKGHNAIIDKINQDPDALYFLKFHCVYRLKKNKLPFVRYQDILMDFEAIFKNDECGYSLESDGATLWMTSVDFQLFQNMYDIDLLDMQEAYFFEKQSGMFDAYIDKFYNLKAEATVEKNPTKRLISKLFMNNLGGKFGTKPETEVYTPVLGNNGVVRYEIDTNDMKTVYVPVIAFITAYGRYQVVMDATNNYGDGGKTWGFVYADTDSIHYISKSGEKPNLPIDPVEMGKYKIESSFTDAKYVRKKTYVEYIDIKDDEPVEASWDIKACGASDEVKERLLYKVDIDKKLISDGDKILNEKKSKEEFLDNFDIGMRESGKLSMKTVKNGKILYLTEFTIRRDCKILSEKDL